MAANTAVIVIFFVAFIASAHGDHTGSIKCSVSNIEVLSNYIEGTINATVSRIVAEATGSLSATVDEKISALNAALDDQKREVNRSVSALNATVVREVTTLISSLNATDDRIRSVSTSVSALNTAVDERITTVSATVGAHDVSIAKLLNQPVIEMLYISLSTGASRTVTLRSIDKSRQAVGNTISTLTIQNTSNAYTSGNNILVYRPNYSSNSGGNTAIIFINLEAAIPCYQANRIGPACDLYTLEEESFQYGKAFVQASDIGNHFRIFSSSQFIATYGFGVSGCSTFNQACVSGFELTLVCLLPPALNQCGI